MWQGVKEDVRDSIWIGRPVYDKFGRKGEIISDMWGALGGSAQFNYRVWVIRLENGGTLQLENAVNFDVPQPFDNSGILYFDGDNWVALSEHPDTAYGISLKQAEFPNVAGHPDYQAVLKDDSWLRQPIVKPPFEPVKEGKISVKDLLDMARRNTKIFGDLSNQSVTCLEPIHEWLDESHDESMSRYTELLNGAKDNSDLADVEFYETASEREQTTYDHNKHLLKEYSVLACDVFVAFIANLEDEYANRENYEEWCKIQWPKRHSLAYHARGVAPPPCPPVTEFLSYYVSNEGEGEVVNQWFDYETQDFIDEYIMNYYQIPAEQQDLDVDFDFHDEHNEIDEMIQLLERYCETHLEDLVFTAYYGEDSSATLKKYREQHYEAETFYGEITTEPMTVYRRMGWKQYYDGLEMGYLHPMKTRMQFRPDENIGGTWGVGQPQIWAARKPIFSSPLKHLRGSEAKQLFEIDIPIGTRIVSGYDVQIFDSIPIENVRPFYVGDEEEYTYLAETFQASAYDYRERGVQNRYTDEGRKKQLAMQFGLDGEGFESRYEPFMFFFDEKGIKQIANVATRYPYNQQQFAQLLQPSLRRVISQKTSAGLHGTVVFLNDVEAKTVQRLWKNQQYCRLYHNLKRYALSANDRPPIRNLTGRPTDAESFYEGMKKLELYMELECQDAARIDHTSRGLMNWDSFTRDDYEAETFQGEQFGTSNLDGFAYYDRLPDLGNPKTLRADVSNIAAPFVVVFDKRGVRSMINVGIKENQVKIGNQMTLSLSKSDMKYFFIYLRVSQAVKSEELWQKGEYCELYEYLKEIASNKKGAFGGREGTIETVLDARKWFHERKIRSIEAMMSVHCEDDDDDEFPLSLGLFNWIKQFSA